MSSAPNQVGYLYSFPSSSLTVEPFSAVVADRDCFGSHLSQLNWRTKSFPDFLVTPPWLLSPSAVKPVATGLSAISLNDQVGAANSMGVVLPVWLPSFSVHHACSRLVCLQSLGDFIGRQNLSLRFGYSNIDLLSFLHLIQIATGPYAISQWACWITIFSLCPILVRCSQTLRAYSLALWPLRSLVLVLSPGMANVAQRSLVVLYHWPFLSG